ncbi:LamG-like jellyroll fold domain-containing protein [Amycolatopsis sp.]|uniref:LamG-like jellyroll fold domain-containing protein n=1 Tax=Amycolatopsis sp. TaxID=37632 RepID=UPI002632174E|nr:LamG-like jellyroll fold domain-containing protein [Amycolatopsis sp.]
MARRSVLPAGRGFSRLLSLLLVIVVGAGVATVAPTSAAAATIGTLPQQAGGSAAGRAHDVSSAATTAKAAGAGHDAPPATGGLGPDQAFPAQGIPESPVAQTSVQVGAPPSSAVAGFNDQTSHELTDQRSATTQVYANADGTKTERKYQEPQFYQVPDGTWTKIDPSLVPDGQTWRTKATPTTERFGQAANVADIASLQLNSATSVGFSVAGASGAAAQVTGDAVTYPDVRPGADLHLQATSSGTKETILLKSKDAPATWDFPLHLAGLTATLDGGGAVQLTDAAGAVQGTIPPGFMEDSNLNPLSDEGARSTAVTYTLVGDAANPVLRVTADAAWLADPARVFPVKVDPTVVGPGTNGSTYTQSPYNADNSGDPNLSVGTYNGGGNTAAAYLKFDSATSGLAGDHILGTKLWMYETYAYSCQARDVSVYPVTQGWSVGGTKTYPGPAYGGVLATASFAHGYDGSCGSQWQGIDLGNNGVNLVTGWRNGAANNGLTVRASDTDSYAWKKFASAASGNAPYLEVTYTPYWATYSVDAMNPQVSTNADGTMAVTVTNQGRDTWTPTNSYKLGYRIWDSAGNELPATSSAWTPMPSTVAPGQSVTVNATVKSLPPGSYTLRWDMDNYGTGRFSWDSVPMSAPVTFTLPNQAPQIDSMSPLSNSNATTLTPTLALSAHDPDNWPGQGVQYRFNICDSTGATCTDSGFLTSPVWSVPAGKLKWGQTYTWYGKATDTNAESPWTLGAYLSTQVPQPAITSHLSSVAGGGVDPGVGNYTTAVTDASVSAVGPALSVVRTYNSLDPRHTAAFGSGWSTRWDTALRPDTDGSGNVVITSPDGRQTRYGRNPDGSYSSPSGETTTLLAVSGGGWTQRSADGSRYAFDTTGRLSTITDVSGRVQTIAYDTAGKLHTATDAVSGRSLTFTWTGNHVTQVTTSSALALAWNYTYTGDQLSKVCDPTNACTSYANTTASHYRSVTLDANPHAYWRLADPAGTTAVSDVPGYFGTTDGTASNLTYGQPGPLAGSPTTAAGFNATSSFVKLPDNLVRNSSYFAVELWFKTTSTAGGVLFSTGNDQPGTAAPGGAMPMIYVGTDGKLYGYQWTGQLNGMASATAVNDGAWHHVALSVALDTQTLYLDGASVGSRTGTSPNIDPNDFIGAGAVTSRAWPARPTNNWGYFSGTIGEVALYHQPLGATVVAEHYAARAASDQLTSITKPGGATAASLIYNGAADRVSQYADANGGTTAIAVPTVEGDGFRYTGAVTDSAPDANWRLNETSGTTADGKAQLDRATYVRGTGGRTTGPFDAASGAQSFDGTTSYARLPDNELRGASQTAVEMWFKTTSTAGGVLLSTGNDLPGTASPGGSMPVLYVGADGKLYGHMWNGSVTAITSPAAVNDGAWHHVALSAALDTQTMYLDGTAVGSTTSGSLPGMLNALDPENFIGAGAVSTRAWPARPTNNWGYFSGSISQVSLYQHTLSATDVTAHYNARGTEVGYLTAVRSSEPHALWGLEDATSSAYAGNDPTVSTATYTNVGLSAAPAMRGGAAASFNGSTSYVRLPDRQVMGRARLGVEMWFQTSATTGGVLYSTGNAPPGSATPGGAMPILYVGTDGKLYGHFWTGAIAGIATPNAVNDGAWHHVVLDGDENTQSLYLDGNLVGSQDGLFAGLDTEDFVGAGYTASNPWPARPTDNWGHFSGSIGEVAVYHRPLDSASIAGHYSAKVAANAVRVTDPAGAVTTYTYDPTRGGRLTTATTPAGGTTQYAYDTGGFLNRVTDENGHATTLVNDARGNALSRTTCRTSGTDQCYTDYRSYYLNTADPLDPRDDRVTADRDARSASATDNTYLTTYAYTTTGAISSTSVPGASTGAQRTSTTTYTAGTEAATDSGTEPAGLLATSTDPAGGVTHYAYNTAGDLTRTTDPVGLVVTYTYDGIGRKATQNVASSTVPGGATTTYGYDAMSRPTLQIDPATANAVTGVGHQRRTATVYNPDGTVTKSTVDDTTGADPARTTAYTYDALGRPKTVTDPAGGVTTTAYDAFGAVVDTIDPSGTEYTSTYTTARHQLATTTVKGFTGDGQAAHDVVLQSRAYDPAGRLASVTDAMGRTTSSTYFDDNLPATQVLTGYLDPATGHTRDLVLASDTYTGTGQVATATKGDGRYSTTTTYDPGGRVTNTTDRDGTTVLRSIGTVVDTLDNPTRVTARNADGSVAADTETGYDPMGRETSATTHTTGTATLVTTIARDERGLPTSTVDPRGTVAGANPAAFTTTYAYDALGQPTTVTAPAVSTETGGAAAVTASPVTFTGYDTFGETVDTRDANGNLTHASYDPAGRPTGITLPAYVPPGQSTPVTASTSTAYDHAGRVTATTDARGNTTTYGYDQLGDQRSKTDPPALVGQAGGTWQTSFDALGEPLVTSDPNGAYATATYDQLGHTLTTTAIERNPAPTRNLTTRYTYDPLGDPVSVTSPSGEVSTATYDDLGHQLTSTTALGKTTSTGYDGAGRTTSVTDPLGNKRTAAYDQAGRVTAQSDVDPHGAILRTSGFGYDGAGNQTTATDPLGATTTQTFNAANELTSTTRPTTATTSITSSYGYDKVGNITRSTDGNGHATVFTVNPWNLPESTIEPATAATPTAADRTYTVAYDRNGKPASQIKPGGVTITNTYDAQGNLTKQTGTGASVATSDRVFGYDPAGRMTSVSTPSGTDNTYTYDDRGDLITATGPSGTSSATFDDDGRQATATTEAGTATYTYDNAGRLATAADPLTGTTATYGYDDASQPTSTAYGTGKAARTFGYDALGRQNSDTITDPAGSTTASTTYGYDTADHLTSKTTTGVAGAAANTYSYDQAGQLATWTNGATTTQYGWDGAGNLTTDGSSTASFNERNQLTAKAGTSYTYTPRGTQASRTTGGTTTNKAFNAYDELTTDATTNYTYDALDRLTTAGTTNLTYAGTGHEITGDGTSTYSYTPMGTPLGVRQGGVASVASADAHTDLTALVDPATGAVTGSRTYSPFGQVTASAGTQTSLGYQDQYTDSASGNVNMGARWFQPSTGGFASRDTTGLDPRDTSNANRYGYAATDPMTGTDPTGRLVGECEAAGVATLETGPGALAVFGGCELGEAALEWLFGQTLRNLAQDAISGAARSGSPSRPPSLGPSFATWPSDYTEIQELRAASRQRTPTGGQPGGTGGSGRCVTHCSSIPKSYRPAPQKAKSSAADDAAAAARMRELLRQEQIDKDARTPHPKPSATATIASDLTELFNDAFNATPIALGILDPSGIDGGDNPYQSAQVDRSTGPGALSPATGQLAGACATGGNVNADGTRSAQAWTCGDAGYARRTANTGVFSGLQVPMQKRVVRQIARDSGVGLDGVTVKINRDPDLIGRGLFGHTSPDGTITLYPDAFGSEEDLVKTLGHERMHVMQVGLYGPATSLEQESSWERAAYSSEDQFWNYYNGGLG